MHYDYPYRYYSEKFGIPERSIKRWVAIGKQSTPPDLPPFDAPAELPAWWTRHMSQRHPAWLAKFLPNSHPSNDANDVSSKINVQENANLLDQAEQHRAIANERLIRAINDGDEGRITQCQRIWVDACEVVVKAERLDAEQQKIRGQWASVQDVSADLASILEHLRQMRTNLARRVTADLASFFNNDQLQHIQSVIVEAQSGQDAILRRLQSMSSKEQAEAWLELEAA